MCELENTEPLWQWDVSPTAAEYEEALRVGELRKAGKGRLIVQSVVLGAVALWSLLPVLFGGTADYMLIGVAIAVCAAMWLVPPLKMKADARQAASVGYRIRVAVWNDGFRFGDSEETVAYETLRFYRSEAQITVAVDDELVPLPFRVMPEACRAFLTQKCEENNHE